MLSKLVTLFLLTVPAIAAQLPSTSNPNAPTRPKEDTCSISGMVIRKDDAAPLKGAIVHLATGDWHQDRERTIAGKTGVDGRFELHNIPAGQYKLTVTRNGFADYEYGQKTASDPGATFTLRPGQRTTDLLFKMARAAVITGHIYDEDGQPMAQVFVTAMRQVYIDGRKQLQTLNAESSNDLGEYRIFGLKPGRYFLSAQPPRWNQTVGDSEFSTPDGKTNERGYIRMYYPGVAESPKAATIVVKEGEEIPSIDFLMKQIQVYRIRGRVINLVSRRKDDRGDVRLMVRGQNLEWTFRDAFVSMKSDGSFEIPEVVPGEYTVMAFFGDEGKFYSAQEDVDVADADINGVGITIGPGTTFPGRVVWDGKPSLEQESVFVRMVPVQGDFFWGGGARVEADGQFTLKDVPQGSFRLELDGISKDCYVKQIRQGESTISDDLLRVSRGSSGNLEIMVSSRGARIEGSVSSEDHLTASGVWVVAVPDESERKLKRLYKSFTSDQYGRFTLRGLAPGTYKLFAWDGIQEGEWQDPDFLKAYEDKGMSLSVSDEAMQAVELQLIPVKETVTGTN